MAIPILTTKLYIPKPRADLVIRPRLLKSMSESTQHGSGLTLVSAPAGFGKTTLVSQWIPHSQHCVAWLSLDAGDNHLPRFLRYFIAAMQSLEPNLGQAALSALQSPQPPPVESLLVLLLNDVAAFPDTFALVLDDYHVIETEAIHQVLTFLLDHLPPNMQLIMTTRIDPPLPLARLRARRILAEIRVADLRFTPEETASLFNQVAGLSLPSAEITGLQTRTEGWITGLQLVALSIQDYPEVSTFIQAFTGSHRYILDYLTDEIFEQQPEEIQAFLLQTSILERFCGPLCDTVVQINDWTLRVEIDDSEKAPFSNFQSPVSGQLVLEQLEAANLFIIPLDNERRWYRYHHLFADLLQARLQQTQPPGQIAELHRRAAKWYEANGLVSDAIRHAIKGNDMEQVVRLVTANAPAMLAQGQVVTLQGWLDALPEKTVYDQPSLCLSQAWLWLLRRRLQAIEPYLQTAEQALADADLAQQVAGQGEIAAIRAFIASEQGHFDLAVELARQALVLLPEDNLFARGSSALALGNALFSLGDTGPAVNALTESVALCRAAGNALGALYSLGTLVVLLKVQGQLRRAEQVLHEAFDWTADRHWQQLPPAAALYIRLGEIRREQNDLTAAEELLRQAVQVAQFGAPILSARAHAFLARVKQSQGDNAAATILLQQVTQICQSWETGQEVAYFTAYRIRLALQQGLLAEATVWAEQLPDWNPEETPNYFREFELVTLARVRLAQAGPQLTGAHALLAWLRQQGKAAGRMGIVIETLILEALTRAAQSDVSEALSALNQALTLAEPEGYLRLFLDEGEPLAALLAQLPPTAYRDRLLAAFAEAETQGGSGAGEKISPSAPPPSRSATLIEPLSDRELEVLRLMADGYSNREIAETLVFTVATAKKHAENIYGKLGVHSRTQAIARARELNLL